jgi:hypothetical protein
LGLNALFGRESQGGYTTGVMTTPTPKKSPKTTPTPENFVMGDVAMPSPTPKNTPKPTEFEMGKVAARNSARL